MAATKPKSARHASAEDTSAAVDAFMAQLEHPHKAAVQALRKVVLATDASIADGIKWNAPSYRTTEYFATTHLRAKVGIALILHLGAKARELPAGGVVIDDPAGLLKWLGKDRALVELRDERDVAARKAALQAVLRQWLRYV